MDATDGELAMRFHVPVRTGRGENNREHPQARARRVKAEHQAVFLATLGTRRAVLAALMPTPVVVTLTRVSPGPGLDPHDNLPSALKGVVDQLADILGINDRDPRVTWKYAPQEKGPWGVWVHVAAVLPGPEVVAPRAPRSAPAKKYARGSKKKPRDFTEALLAETGRRHRAGESWSEAVKNTLSIPRKPTAAAAADRQLAALASPAFVAPRRSP
jgi:hypothetical protein